MEDITGVKNNSQKIAGEVDSGANALGEALSTLANIFGVIGGPVAIVELFQLIKPKADPVIKALQNIQGLLEAALHFEIVNDSEEHQFHIKDVMSPSETSWGTLNEVSFDTRSPLLSVDTLQHDTYGSLNTLADPIYWHRPYYDQLDYNDVGGWFHHVIPPDISERLGPALKEVFDYRLVLPSFLYAIQIRCAVVSALHSLRPEIVTDDIFRDIQTQEFQPAVETLRLNYEKIVAGFVPSRMPDASSRLDQNAWYHAGNVIGVIDSYAGSGYIDAMPVNQSFDDDGFPVWNDDFDRIVFPARYQLGILSRWKTLYINTGLHGAWVSLQSFKVLAGKDADVEHLDKRASWSLKEIHEALGSALRDAPPPANAPISAAETVRRLYGISKLPLTDPNSFLPRELSLRYGLNTVIDQTRVGAPGM